MKRNLIIILMFFTISITSCKKDYLSLEQNPNTPSVFTPQFLLSGAQKVTADIVNINYQTYGIWVGYTSPSGNFVPNAALIQYNYTTSDYQVWAALYGNLSNYDFLEKSSSADPNFANFEAIAKIMKAYGFQALVDNYNNVPYTEAFKGSANISPKYDKGEVIYDDLLKQLDAAIAKIKGAGATAVNPGSSDIMFNGAMTNWIKFANTLKLRLVLRQWKLTAKRAALTSALNTTNADGYLSESIDASTTPGYANDDANGGKQSPFWRGYGFDQSGNAFQANQYYRANAYGVKVLKDYADPRLTKMYDPIPNGPNVGKVLGNDFGDPNSLPNASTSAIGLGLLKSPTMKGVIMSSAEALFLQSEGALYGIVSGSAQQFYEKGISSSFIESNVPSAATQAVTYYTQPKQNISWTASSDKLQAIIVQKWISLNGYGNFESYNEYRRTGYPLDVPRSVASGASGTTIPARIFYPNSEYQQNAANVKAEGTIDRFTSKIFWAK